MNIFTLDFMQKLMKVLEHLSGKRDDMGIFNDDLIGFDIDTYGDGRNNIFIGSNPYGSQFDVRILNSVSEEGRYDISYDLEYESKGSIGNNEYFVELKIPFHLYHSKWQRSEMEI